MDLSINTLLLAGFGKSVIQLLLPWHHTTSFRASYRNITRTLLMVSGHTVGDHLPNETPDRRDIRSVTLLDVANGKNAAIKRPVNSPESVKVARVCCNSSDCTRFSNHRRRSSNIYGPLRCFHRLLVNFNCVVFTRTVVDTCLKPDALKNNNIVAYFAVDLVTSILPSPRSLCVRRRYLLILLASNITQKLIRFLW